MRRKGIILATLAGLTVAFAQVSTALASGPLLSGYGGPGAGAQTIIGATLLKAPRGGSGGSSSGDGFSPSSSTAAFTTGARGVATASHGGLAASRNSGRGSKARRALRTTDAGRHRSAEGVVGSYSGASHTDTSADVSMAAGASWFTGGDLLALVLVAGALTLMGVATVRLAGRGTDHG